MKKVTISDFESRLKATLSKSRCPLSIEDTRMLEAAIQVLSEMKELTDSTAKMEKVGELAAILFEFYAKNDLLAKYGKALDETLGELV